MASIGGSVGGFVGYDSIGYGEPNDDQCGGCEWWIGNDGINYLAGDAVNCDNIPRLCDEWIICMLVQIPAARESFLRIVGNMCPEEQERLWCLWDAAQGQIPVIPEKEREDAFQRRQNTAGIHTAGPLGGLGC